MTLKKIAFPLIVVAISAVCAYADKQPRFKTAHAVTPEQALQIDAAIAREHTMMQAIRQRTPLVETYIQNTRPDEKLNTVPVSDEYMLSRIDFNKTFVDTAFASRSQKSKSGNRFFQGSAEAFRHIGKALGLDKFTYNPTGFMQMMFVDPIGFDRDHYAFSFVRQEFLGSIRTAVYDVQPTVKGMGRFYGRIWIEDQDNNIVRLNGGFTHPREEAAGKYFFHFDSWRGSVQPGEWLPVAVYVEESTRIDGENTYGLKAQTHFWGYSLKLPTRDSENVSVKVEDAVDTSDDAGDVGPLQASRMWVNQAENNVIDRLVEAGLVAPVDADPVAYEHKILDQIVTNLEVPNNLALPEPVRTRVMLSTTIEATTVGNTILLSKGLLDSMPNEPAIASVVAMELAHIELGHHIDTRYAFNDRLMFPDTATFQRIAMYHTDHDNADAAKRAMEYLGNSMYKDQLPDAGIYYAQLVDRSKALKALNTPKLGDSLLMADGTPWMAALPKLAPKINWDDLAQRPANPLGFWLKTDPWDDKVHQVNAKIYAYLNARDKMPFEVTPVYFRLQRYSADATSIASASGWTGTDARNAKPDGGNHPVANPVDKEAAQDDANSAQPANNPEQR